MTWLLQRKLSSVWQELRANKLGVHFRRQQVIAGFIVEEKDLTGFIVA